MVCAESPQYASVPRSPIINTLDRGTPPVPRAQTVPWAQRSGGPTPRSGTLWRPPTRWPHCSVPRAVCRSGLWSAGFANCGVFFVLFHKEDKLLNFYCDSELDLPLSSPTTVAGKFHELAHNPEWQKTAGIGNPGINHFILAGDGLWIAVPDDAKAHRNSKISYTLSSVVPRVSTPVLARRYIFL